MRIKFDIYVFIMKIKTFGNLLKKWVTNIALQIFFLMLAFVSVFYYLNLKPIP